MKKLLFIGGFSAIGVAFYYYFKNQIDLALNYDLNIKSIRFLELTTSNIKIDASIAIENKSSFSVDILDYNLILKYKSVPIANAVSIEPVTIKSDSTFNVHAISDINLINSKAILLPLSLEILSRKPIKVEIEGYINITLLGIPKTIEFNNESYNYSEDVISEFGLNDELNKAKQGVSDLLGKIGIKL
jgi:LEA14-like dessication related protein